MQEIVPPAELKRLKEQADAASRRSVRFSSQVGQAQSLTRAAKHVDTITSFLQLSDEAENRNDMRQADGFAERAEILAKELQSGQ